MTKIIMKADCGNSPKMQFLKDFNIAFAKGDIDYLINAVTEDFVWNIVGSTTLSGKEAFLQELQQMNKLIVKELAIDKVLSHGREGAASGSLTMEDGKTFAFSDHYEFKGAKGTKIKAMTSYVISI
ncbi:nuclear transport factor 2 family protein [Robertkochia solimangrovi]|uniref:nuclear transport factor 2 family protein n=1 Tax=Robertkochia solimangrovi TaxID=2213046 RepID=UPI00117CB8A6|nr:nuclear transport factor 2 family protein [Robertkochia solimangrovi]TRZ45701.1 nuclear transport factor 2 family protein [Robertkochia solimangrovi]